MFRNTAVLTVFILLCNPAPVKAENVENLPDHEDGSRNTDDGFLITKTTDRIFTVLKHVIVWTSDTLLLLAETVESILHYITTMTASVLDTVIRHPTNVLINVLQAVSWIVQFSQHLVLDVILQGIFVQGILLLFKVVFSVIETLISTPFAALNIIIEVLRAVTTAYLTLCSLPLIYVIYPCLYAVYWTLTYLTVIMGSLWGIFELKRRSADVQRFIEETGWKCVVILPLIVATFKIWHAVSSIILDFVCYPATTVIYSFIVVYGTYEFFRHALLKLKIVIVRIALEEIRPRLEEFEQIVTQLATSRFQRRSWAQKIASHDSLTTTNPQNDNSPQECVICLEERPLVILMPCGHKVICEQCTEILLQNDYRCPMDRTTIQQYYVAETRASGTLRRQLESLLQQ